MTNTNNKIRAVVLAALMVLSVFAGTVAFTGTAAAAATAADSGNLTATDVAPDTSSTTQTITFDLDDGGSAVGQTEVAVDLSAATGAGVSVNSFSASISNNTGGYTLDDTPTASGGVITFNVTDANAGADNATVTLTVDHDTTGVGFTSGVPVSFDVAGSDAGSTTFNVASPSRTVDAGDTVYLGETDVDISGIGGSPSNLIGISGEAEGSTASVADPVQADITEANNFVAGGYSSDGDNDVAELFVTEPQVTGLTIYQGPIANDVDITDGSISTETAENSRINVEPEFNFEAAEQVEIIVEDEDGLEITDDVLDGRSATADNEGNISLDFSGQDTGEYTITVEGEDDLDDTSRSATLTLRDETTSISISESTVTKGDSIVATVTGEPGDVRLIQIDSDDLDNDEVDATDVFADTSDVTRDDTDTYNNNGFVAADLDLGDDGEAQTRINTDALDTASIDIEVVESGGSIGDDAEETAELSVEEQEINITSAPNVVRIGEDFDIEGESPESEEVAAYARIDDDYELLSGDDNPVDVDSDGSFTIEADASSPINLADSYRIVIVTEEALGVDDAPDGEFPGESDADNQLSSDTFGELDTTTTFSLRTVEGDLTAESSSASIAADVDDEITISGTALGQGDEVRIYQVGPRGDVEFRTPDIEEEEFDEDFSNFDTRGSYTFIVIGQGRDGNFAADADEVLGEDDSAITGDESPQQAVAIINDEYTGAGVDDQLVELTVQAENPQLTIDDFTTDGQVAQGDVTISGTSNREDETTVFIEVLGDNDNVVASTEAEVNGSNSEWEATIDMSDVETGTYTLRADDDEASAELEFEVVESVSTPTETPAPETETETPAPETETETPAPETETETPAPETETTTSTSTPGFGAIVALVALIAAALLAIRRD